MNLLPVSYTKIHPDALVPTYATSGSCGFDLAPVAEATIAPNTIALLGTGLRVKTPEGYVFMITPRSSTAKKWSLEFPHSIGIIDQDYCGPTDEILIQVRNVGTTPVTIPKGTRIAQGLFIPVAHAVFLEQDIHAESRGGVGSTG